MRYNRIFILVSALLYFVLSLATDLSNLECSAISIFVYNFINYFYTLGKKININELVLIIASVQILLMPTITYVTHPEKMPLDSENYFSYTVLAILALNLGFSVKFYQDVDHKLYLRRVREYLVNKQEIGVILFITGLLGTLASLYAPISLKNVANLFATCLYIAVLYGIYINGRFKYTFFSITLSIMLIQIVQQGMFGQIIIWSLIWMSFICVEIKSADSLKFKAIIIFSALVIMPILQTVKFQYRVATWGDTPDQRRGDAELMQKLIVDNVQNFNALLDSDILFGSFSRLNQGYLIATAMAYVPHYEPYANGEVLKNLLYPFIPRFIWSEKPITGGYENIRRFTGVENSANNSTNLSPIGEGYVNFGAFGGAIFLFLYGLVFNYFLKLIFKMSDNKPSLILWIPSLYVATLSIETDVLTIWGTFVNGAIFLFLFIQLLRRINISL